MQIQVPARAEEACQNMTQQPNWSSYALSPKTSLWDSCGRNLHTNTVKKKQIINIWARCPSLKKIWIFEHQALIKTKNWWTICIIFRDPILLKKTLNSCLLHNMYFKIVPFLSFFKVTQPKFQPFGLHLTLAGDSFLVLRMAAILSTCCFISGQDITRSIAAATLSASKLNKYIV